MTDFIEQLQLAEKAREDIFFARINRQLIEALRSRLASNSDPTKGVKQSKSDDAHGHSDGESQGS